MQKKISFIGAGSTVFAKNLIGDILSFPELQDVELCLHDISAERLRVSKIMAERIAATLDVSPGIVATIDRSTALKGADYVIAMFQIGGLEPATLIDFELPKKYGLRQTIGDTLGIGGIMRGLRTIPVMLDILRDMEEHCPDAMLLNYVNPMAMNVWAMKRYSEIPTIGLCHSVPHTANLLARDLDIPPDELNYLVAGINHLAFFLRLERGGIDQYPALREIIRTGHIPANNQVRYDFMKHVGYFVTESSEHLSEYVPYYIKRDRPDLIAAFNIPLDEYPRRLREQYEHWDKLAQELESEESPILIDGSEEYAPEIIHSLETNTPRRIYCNVQNHGLIDNLPQECVVEVPCLVDANGVQAIRIGKLPPHLAALMQTNINVQMLTVEAALSQKREHIYHAAMLDPHTAAELDLDTIRAMVDDLLIAHEEYLPEFH